MGNRLQDIVLGSDVIDADGEKIGTVERVEANHVIVKKGWLFPDEQAIAASAIAVVADDGVRLSVTKDALPDRTEDADPAARDSATIQPSSNDTPPSEGGIAAAPHMGDDDYLTPIGTTGDEPEFVTPSPEGETSDRPMYHPPADPDGRPH